MNSLTKDQRAALQWLADFPSHRAGWRRNGKLAYGPPETWDAMEIVGKRGSIMIPVGDWESISPRLAHVPNTDKIYQPKAGALAAA